MQQENLPGYKDAVVNTAGSNGSISMAIAAAAAPPADDAKVPPQPTQPQPPSAPPHYDEMPPDQALHSNALFGYEQAPTYVPLGHSMGNQDHVFDQKSGGLAIFFNLIFFLMGGGLLMMVLYVLFASIFALTVVGWPIAVDLLRMSLYAAFPYGSGFRPPEKCSCKRFGLQVVWLPFGLTMYMIHIFFAILYMMSLIFIPFGLVHFSLAKVSLYPFNFQTSRRKVKCGDLYSLSYHLANEVPQSVTPP
jgi:uncharacterized membrane protein YccF (DUF307 family)